MLVLVSCRHAVGVRVAIPLHYFISQACRYVIREVPGYDFPCQNPYGRYGFFPDVLHTIFRHGESVLTGFHTNHVSYGDFASSGAEIFFAYKFGTRNIDFPREVLISVQIFQIERHSAGM